jgi:hypothetical protein
MEVMGRNQLKKREMRTEATPTSNAKMIIGPALTKCKRLV